MSSYLVEGPAKRIETMSIKRLMEINCIRGQRHREGLPLRGQRTRRMQEHVVEVKKQLQVRRNN